MKFGIIGLGRMGGNLARQAIRKGHAVVGYSKSGVPEELLNTGIEPASSAKELIGNLPAPGVIFSYVPHGEATDQVCRDMGPLLSRGDVLADGGNSHWRDSVRRYRELQARGVGFLDVGTSGGVEGALHSACFMVGGDDEAFHTVEPILRDLAVPEGAAHVGPAGAGHFAKLIHNAIEFGMVQAIAEGVDLLKRSEYRYDLAALLKNWAHGSVIRGWLVELMERGLRDYPDFGALSSYVEDTREVRWAVEYALEKEAWIPVIALSELAFYRYRDTAGTTAKAVAVLRHEFGGHPVHSAGEQPSELSKHAG